MDNITHSIQTIALSGPPSSVGSSASNILANASSTSSSRPSSATSISITASEAAVPSHKPSQVSPAADNSTVIAPGKPKNSNSDASIVDDSTQGHVRAQRRHALARKISAHLRSLPAPSSTARQSSSPDKDNDSAPSDSVNLRQAYLDALIAREPEIYTPVIASYFADHPNAIPTRTEDAATRRRKRYDEYELMTNRDGSTVRVSAKQRRVFDDWQWETAVSTKAGAKAREDDVGPKGERERGEEVRCAHCERTLKRNEIRRAAKKGLRKLFRKKGKEEDEGNFAAAKLGDGAVKGPLRTEVVRDSAEVERIERVVDSGRGEK